MDRLVYLPPDPRQEAPRPPVATQWPPGNWALGPQAPPAPGPPGGLARLGLLGGPAWGPPGGGVRRAQSFNTGHWGVSILQARVHFFVFLEALSVLIKSHELFRPS